MACADISMDIEDHEEESVAEDQRGPLMKYYQASELMPSVEGPLHDLLQKQPAVLGSLQMVSGVLSVGLGVILAVTQEMNGSLFALFRVSHLTGSLFIIAGLLSNLLFKCPRLLPVCFFVNLGSIIVAVLGAVLISIDLALWNSGDDHLKQMEVLELCVLVMEVLLSVVLCFWFCKERHSHSH